MSEAPAQPKSAVVTDVALSRRPDRTLVVTWKVVGECDRIDIAVGRSADGVDHEHAMTVDASTATVELAPGAWATLAGHRVYVSVGASGQGGATVAGERNVGLAGPVNFRDLGGYRAAGGSTVRWGRVFRSDALILLDQDVDQFAGLGIKTVYDLRSDMERDSNPNEIPDHVRRGIDVQIAPLVNVGSDRNPMEGLDLADGEKFLAGMYTRVLERSAPNFGQVLTGLADEPRLPAVFHCMAGKDRTGMVAAVLLGILGVCEDDIMADYELTGEYRDAERVRASMARLEARGQLRPEVLAGILRAPGWAMRSAFETVRDRHGDFDGYLTGPGEADSSVPDRLRQLLLVT